MLRLRKIIHDRSLSSEEKYENLISLINKLDGRFIVKDNGKIEYKPNEIETKLPSGIIFNQHGYTQGNAIIRRIVRNDADNNVGIAIARRINFIEDTFSRKIFYEKEINGKTVREIMKTNEIGYERFKLILNESKKIIKTYMCLNIDIESLNLIEEYEKRNNIWYGGI